jgi:hypothetical protein bacD2_24025
MNKKAISETKRSWRNALETIKQVEEAFPEYTKSIIPATVQTMMALVGNKSGQFAFVANKTNPITVPHTLYFDKNNKQINAGSGWIKHYTLGTTDIKPSHSAADYKYWYVSQFVSGRLDDKAKSYYLYIRANKAIETAEFVLSETKIGMEQEAGFYHFLYATVNSEYDGERGIAQLNGFTEITGGQMVTNRIASGNGQQFIALYDDRIEINAHLQISESNKLEFKQLVNPDLQSLENRLKQYSNEQMDNIQMGGKNLLRNSKQRITNSNYNIATYRLTEELRDGDVVTLTIKGQLGAGKTAFVPYNSGDRIELSQLLDKGNGIYQNTFVWRTRNQYSVSDNKTLWIWTFNYNVIAESTIEWIKLERGNKPTDWSPAPEDVESKIDQEKQNREQAVANAKSATEEYVRAQADLLKLQAIAEANRNAGLAITAEQQARIQEAERNLQAAKTHAEREVSKINIGGRNLILNSKERLSGTIYSPGWIKQYSLSQNLEIGFTYILSIKNYHNVPRFFLWNSGWSDSREIFVNIPFTVSIAYNKIFLHTRDLPHEYNFEMIKLEKGNKPTDWSPAPEDVENKIANINSDLDTIRRNAARIEALENQNKANTDQRIGKLDQKTAFLNDTQIAGNVVATGTMIVGNTTGTQAGITGVGNATNEVRFWAGSEFGGRYAAPFRVLQDGTLYATKANISGAINATSGSFTGKVNATSGQIGQFYINTEENKKRGRIYAGSRNTSEITIGNTGVEIESDSPLSKLSASFGHFNSMVLWNTYAAQKIDYTGSSSNMIGSYIKMRPQNNNLGESFAQFIDGNIFSIGKKSVFEDGYIGTAYTNAIVDNIKYTHTYIFTGVESGYMYVNLPNSDRIKQIVGNNNIAFELTIVMAHSVGKSKIVVQGVPGGHILDNDGGRAEGGNGYIEMARGDVMKLCFYGAYYYISSLRR